MQKLTEFILSVQLDYTVFTVLTLAMMAVAHFWVRRSRSSSRLPTLAWCVVVPSLAIGFVVTNRVDQSKRAEVRSQMEAFGRTYAQELAELGHGKLPLDAAPDDPLYLKLIEAEKRWLNANDSVSDIYTFRKRADGQIVLFVDSETDYDRNGIIEGERESRTAIGEPYMESRDTIEQAFRGKASFEDMPVTDRWGTWISALYPIRDQQGRVEAVLGVDYPAAAWLETIMWHRITVMGGAAIFEFVLIVSSSLITILKTEVHERRKVEQKLAIYQRELEEQVRVRSEELLEAGRQMMHSEKLASLGQLAAGVAHEINTPIQYVGDNLRAISDFLGDLVSLTDQYRQVIEQIQPEGELQAMVEKIREAEATCDLEYIREDAPKAVAQGLEGVQRVAHIVGAMKDFSHVDRGQVSMVDINRSLQNTLTVARNEYKYVADVKTELGELPAIEAYGSELNQVFLNILVNAAHAIGDTGKRGMITLRTRAEGDHVEVAISDTGKGIPPEIWGKIFDPFFTTKPVGKGTGQGLNIAHQIVVAKHGGALRFETEMDKGTTFFIQLPLKLGQAASAETDARQQPSDADTESAYEAAIG